MGVFTLQCEFGIEEARRNNIWKNSIEKHFRNAMQWKRKTYDEVPEEVPGTGSRFGMGPETARGGYRQFLFGCLSVERESC